MSKVLKILLVSVIILGLTLTYGLVGCKTESTTEETVGEEKTEEAVEEVSEEEVEEEVPSEPIRITSWGNPHIPDAIQAFIDGFNEAQDKYILEHIVFPDPFEQTLLNKWAAGERPDVVNLHSSWFRKLNPEENLLDLSDMDFVQRTMRGLLEATTKIGDAIYGPCILSPMYSVPAYNKEIFAELNLEVPTTYEGLLEVCQVIKDNGYTPLFDCGGDQWTLTVTPYALILDDIYNTPDLAEKFNNNEMNWSDPPFYTGLERLAELLELEYFNDDVGYATFEEAKTALENNEAAIVLWGWDGLYQQMLDAFGIESAEKIGFMPIGTNEPAVLSLAGNAWACWYIVDGQDPEKVEGSKELIRYLSGAAPYEEYYQKLCDDYNMQPVFEGFTQPDSIPEELKKLFNSLDDIIICPLWGPHMVGSSQEGVHLSAFVAGTITLEEAVEAINADFANSARDAGAEAFQD